MKSIQEVLPGYKPSEEVGMVLQFISVDRVVMSKNKQTISVYVTAERLIPKRTMFKLEDEIKTQFFGHMETVIRVRENYVLSDAYTASYIMDEYRDSLLLELSEYNRLIYLMFLNSSITFPEEDLLQIEIEDTMIARSKGNELERILHKVLNERFHKAVTIEVIYVEAESEIKKKEESFIDQTMREVEDCINNEVMFTPSGSDRAAFEDVSASSIETEDSASGNTADAHKADTNKTVAKKSDVKKADAKKSEDKKSDFRKDGKKDFNSKDKGKGRKFERNRSYEAKTYVKSEDMIYGRNFSGEPIPLEDVQSEMGEICVQGEIVDVEIRELRTGNHMCIFHIFDGTDSIAVKAFLRPDALEDVTAGIKKGEYVAVRGVASFDSFDKEVAISSVRGIRKEVAPPKVERMDNSPRKRVELHCHTKFSEMDAVSDVSELMKTVYKWGMTAVAITDHGNVQAFTEAYHKLDSEKEMKLLYGMEGYLVDDLVAVVDQPGEALLTGDCVVISMKTTGINNQKHKILELGAVRIIDGVPEKNFYSLVNPQEPITLDTETRTHISDVMVGNAPLIIEILPKLLDFIGDASIVSHNPGIDIPFIETNCKNCHIEWNKPPVISTDQLTRYFLPGLKKIGLEAVAKALGLNQKTIETSLHSAQVLAGIWLEYVKMLKERDIVTLSQINVLTAPTPETIRKAAGYYHIILIAKNDLGRVNLYRMVSESHLKYFNRRPRLPKSLLMENREGIIVGAACEAGELYRALVNGADDNKIKELCEFYDYLEIQPTGNNRFMFDKPELGIHCDEDIENLNRRVYELGQIFNKPVVATCDSHFMKPEDAIYRAIIQAGQGFKDSDNQPPLYFRTTEEMLQEFQYLGERVAEEIVITNTNMIADMCEPIDPVRPDKCPPVIENSDKELRDMCYETARSIYGPDLPTIVTDRLDKELNSIISNGYSVMYIIAQRLVKKSNDDGYLVGSRGSVGSSLAATMSGITEVNPLSPHYYCPECHYYDFDSEDVKAFGGMAGCDMPDKDCPVCGQPLKKEGFDIPFETFLGFKGDKEPDIDLNFSGEYQSKAHDYTEVLFGKGHTFKAGTIGTLAEKTAYGYVKKYYEERDTIKRRCEIERVSKGCVGVKRGTGQHPGGIIVMPHGEEIHSFTAIQHPANDMTTNIITTHFDYHSIDHNLLKLDILGHDDPTMIRMLEDLLHIDARKIPLDSPEVMSLFASTDALGITPDDIDGVPLGTLGVPEFGTDFAMQMLVEAKPKYFSDLVRIAGLAHGTAVWLGNAQDLIREGTATIQTAICTRDDIMIYLIAKGMDPEKSFKIMEKVRKGKGLKPDEEELMRANNVPEWYIDSCKKIQYMFPKAHAAAYVMMAWRIAYCKIFHPLEYYTSFFSIRADMFSYEMMCLGRPTLDRHLHALRDKMEKEKPSATEKTLMKDMRIVQEMYARGFEFAPIDLYKAKATRFQIIDGKIMPSFMSIDGLGESVAISIEEAAKQGPFLSLEDFADRTSASSTIINMMKGFGMFGDLPETNQLDFMSMLSEFD